MNGVGKGHFDGAFLSSASDERVPLRRHLARTTNVGMGQRVLRTTSKQDRRLAKLEYHLSVRAVRPPCMKAKPREDKEKEERKRRQALPPPTRVYRNLVPSNKATNGQILRVACLGIGKLPATRPPRGRRLGQAKSFISR